MNLNRTKRLTLNRALKLLQMEYGTQVEQVKKEDNLYIANSICGEKRTFTKLDILNIENEMYSNFGC
jgi:hypothetical protein